MRIDAAPEEPFGAHRAPGLVERLRALGSRLPSNALGLRCASLLRRICFAAGAAPYDVEVFPGVFARLRPATNRTEKRVFLAPQLWDGEERKALERALAASDPSRPFLFVDVGANVGLYGLALAACARRDGRMLRVIAVEPDATNRGRLEVNVRASGLSEGFVIEPVAVGRTAGVARLVEDSRNRGEVHVARDEDVSRGEDLGGVEVRVDTLAEVLARNRVTVVDAMKVDVEGMDYEVLAGLFEQAPPALWPQLLVVELGRDDGALSPLLDLIAARGYRLEKRTKLNAVAVRAG